jgi:hypothetical protein
MKVVFAIYVVFALIHYKSKRDLTHVKIALILFTVYMVTLLIKNVL